MANLGGLYMVDARDEACEEGDDGTSLIVTVTVSTQGGPCSKQIRKSGCSGSSRSVYAYEVVVEDEVGKSEDEVAKSEEVGTFEVDAFDDGAGTSMGVAQCTLLSRTSRVSGKQ